MIIHKRRWGSYKHDHTISEEHSRYRVLKSQERCYMIVGIFGGRLMIHTLYIGVLQNTASDLWFPSSKNVYEILLYCKACTLFGACNWRLFHFFEWSLPVLGWRLCRDYVSFPNHIGRNFSCGFVSFSFV